MWASAEQICDFITKGTTPPKNLLSSGTKEIPFLRVTNLTNNGSLNFVDQVFVDANVHGGFLKGVDLYVVKEYLGHSTIQVTERYAHLAPDKLAHAAEILDEYE